MCGFAGCVDASGVSPDLIERMAATLTHRGPDERGSYLGPGVGLGFCRLSIIDLETGNQPLASEDGRVRSVFNGEIYNYRELRARLEKRGHRFATQGDAEVIPHLYEELGVEFVNELRGMFAIALWDDGERRLLLARDPIGEKPLYYTDELPGGGFGFASEMKALLAAGVSREPDRRALAEYLYHLYVPAPRSAFAAIRKLLPGHVLVREHDGKPRLSRYWEPRFETVRRSEEEHVAGVREHVLDAVRSRMVADVPLGAFLSGGVDSATVVAAMSAAAVEPVHTFTITFDGFDHSDESADARAAARHFGTEHHELRGSLDAAALVPTLVESFDEPFGNATAALLWALSRETRKHVKVALTGDGADELFFGYPRYRGFEAAQRYGRLPAVARRLGALAATAIPESTTGRHSLRRAREFLEGGVVSPTQAYSAWIGYFTPDALESLVSDELADEAAHAGEFLHGLTGSEIRDLNELSRVELQSFLPYNVLEYADKMSMAHGLELRAPFVDRHLIDYVGTLPPEMKLRGRVSKWALRRAFEAELPPATLAKPKLGLNPPLGSWLAGAAEPLVRELLDPAVVRRRGLLRPEAVETLLAEQRSGRRDRSLHVWALVMLEMWFRLRVDSVGNGNDSVETAWALSA